ncbi:MAG TPA: serpin family protein [Pirellulales bacterium]|nr:serpin family protein [Pirellulales bacterium]
MFASRLKLGALAVATIFCTACGASTGAEPARKVPVKPAKNIKLEVTADVRAVARSGNELAFDLYGRLRETQGNLFFSPASISTALAMVYAGARGDTEIQMARTLHFELPDERLLAGFATFSQALNSGGKNYQLTMANRLWGQKSYAFRPKYLEITREQFGAELATLDFARSEAARQTINRWIEQQTNDKIADLIAPGALNAMTRLVLTNAIYFKGAWRHEFWKNATAAAPFHLSKQKDVQAPLMHQVEDFPYAETDEAQIVALPYYGGDLSLVVLLPKEIDGLKKLEAD